MVQGCAIPFVDLPDLKRCVGSCLEKQPLADPVRNILAEGGRLDEG